MASSQDILPPPVHHPTLKSTQPTSPKDFVIAHPSGSEGWLPAEIPPVKQETVVQPAKRKSALRSPSTSKPTTAARLAEGGQATVVINDDETAAPSEEELQNRVDSANSNLTERQRSKIAKSEAKDGRRISKIIKEEGKTGKQALDISINELETLQKYQRNAVKSEAHAHANHSKAHVAFKKIEATYLTAKMRYETSLAELQAEADTLETLKNNSREAAEKVQEKTVQVEALRKTLAVEERERELRLSGLKLSTVDNGTGAKRFGSLRRS